MLRTRVLTGCILGALLLLGLFLLPAFWAVLAFGVVFTIGAWEWAGFGALRTPPVRALYTLIVALALGLSWRWTAESSHLIILLSAACAWWVIAFFWLSLAPTWNRPSLTLICGLAVLAPAFVALARLQISAEGFARGSTLAETAAGG